MSKLRDFGTWIFALGTIALLGVFYFQGGAANLPGLFATGSTSLDAAVAQAQKEDRVVFALATADWCGPCQVYKKNALSDPRVERWVAANAEPLYLDVDARGEDAARLGVRGIPATFIIKDGVVVDRIVGAASADQLLGWLEQNELRAGAGLASTE